MSFLKIKDPLKRDKLVAEYLKTKNKIQENFRSERLGEQSLYENFGKIFKPITEQQKKSSEEIVPTFSPLQEAIENIPPALPWGPELEGQPEALLTAVVVVPVEPPLSINIGRVADQYLRASHGKRGDHTYGLKDKYGQFFLGDAEVGIDEMI